MKNFYTTNEFFSLLIVLLGSMLTLTSCSTSEATKNSQIKTSEKTFIFRDGKDIYRVEFDGNRISSLYKNENKVSDNEIDNYNDLVENELKNLTKDFFVKKEKPKRIRIFIDKEESEKDTTQFEKDKEVCPMIFRFKLDEDILKDMRLHLDSLMNELKDKDFEVYINPDELREKMKEFKKHFKHYTLPEPPEIDLEEFNREMKKFNEQLKRQKPLIDSLEIELREKLNELKKLKKENQEI